MCQFQRKAQEVGTSVEAFFAEQIELEYSRASLNPL